MKRKWVVVAVLALGVAALVAGAALAEKARKHEEKVTLDQVPQAVKATILKEAGGAKIKEIEKETKGERTVFEAEFVKDGKEIEIKVAPDGTLLKREVEGEEEEHEGRREHEEHEQKVTLDQVPAAVKATILKEAGGAKIREIEKETKGDRTIYEAEFVKDGKEIEIKVAPDGTLLKRKVEREDDDEDDDR